MKDTPQREEGRLLSAWPGGLALAIAFVAAVVLALAPLARSTPTNVVPNPGFEQAGCQGTPIICGWQGYPFVDRVGSPGNYSMILDCGPLGCYSGGMVDSAAIGARTVPSFCAAIGPGPHPASFSGTTSGDSVSLSAYFYRGADCTGPLGGDSLVADWSNDWHEAGVLVAPPGTQSALFSVGASKESGCSDYCLLNADFANLDVEDTVLPIPAVSSFGAAGGLVGASVDIQGWNLTDASSVAFNGTAANFTVVSNSEIRATVPDGATTGPISVTTAEGTATSKSTFTVTSSPEPAISSFMPMAGQVGTSVEIFGWDFTGVTSVGFNGKVANFTLDSDSELHATVPSGATAGVISVTTLNGTAQSCCFWVPPPPSISSFTPTSGPPGTSVDIQGENFTGTTVVTFNGAPATFTIDSPNKITATVPSGATNGPISVTTPEGTATSLASYTANTPPVARLTISCTALTCVFDGGTSTDSDGTIQAYSWNFGDGTNSTGRAPSHTYVGVGGYVVTLTVTDDGGASDATSKNFTPISLTAHGYRTMGIAKVDLTWTGPSGASFEVRRNGTVVATIAGGAYTDTIGKTRGAYSYQVCTTTSVCSNRVAVSF